MQKKWLITALGLLLAIGISGVGMILLRLTGVDPSVSQLATQTQVAQADAAQTSAAQTAGDYSGVVKLQFTLAGVYGDTLATPPPPADGTPAPPDLGSIDLALTLSQTVNAVNGYVSLEKTLVFTDEHTIQVGGSALKIGPYVNGTFDGTKLTLQSERISTTLNGRSIQRQFQLTGAISQSDGSQVSGEYRETLWGVARQPVTMIGAFALQRPVFDDNVPDTSNKIPDTVADGATTAQGEAVTINVLANDSDANGDALTVTAVSKPQFGAANTNGQTVTYTPNANFVGGDSFSYIVSDSKGGEAAGSVTVTVNGADGPNQPPSAASDNIGTMTGTAVTINVLGNDSDPNGDTLLISIDTPPGHGAAVVQNGQIVYTPEAGYTGIDSFTYIVSDGRGGTATATVTINISASGQPAAKSIYLPQVQH